MKILLSEGAMTALTRLGGYVIESRGHIDVKVILSTSDKQMEI